MLQYVLISKKRAILKENPSMEFQITERKQYNSSFRIIPDSFPISEYFAIFKVPFMILSFHTNRADPDWTASCLIRVVTVCHSTCIFDHIFLWNDLFVGILG